MKLALAVILAAAAAPSSHAIQPVVDGSLSLGEEFAVWESTYEKAYEGKGERNARFAIWEENREKVIAHNAEAAAGKYSFTLELNHLADLTNPEYKQMMLGYSASFARDATDYTPKMGAAPDSWDWRDTANIVNPVKNQGSCGSCWAFSAVATMEGAYNKKTGKLTSFSEQELVDCVNDGANTCSVGGEMYQGVEYGVQNGMMLESDYSYKGTSGNKCALDSSKVVTKFAGYSNITSGDEAALKEAAYAQPIVSVGIDASSFWFQLYFGGVYDHSGCKNQADELDHGVAVVGYGNDSSSGKDFWLVRNSWGASWGMKGYIKMVRNKDNQCGVATQACFATV